MAAAWGRGCHDEVAGQLAAVPCALNEINARCRALFASGQVGLTGWLPLSCGPTQTLFPLSFLL